MLQVATFFSKLPPIPIVGLTGSLTREQEVQIIHNILNANGNAVKTLRTATMRTNIKLFKQVFDSGLEGAKSLYDKCAKLIEQQGSVGTGRTIVICRLRTDVAKMKGKLAEMGVSAEVRAVGVRLPVSI